MKSWFREAASTAESRWYASIRSAVCGSFQRSRAVYSLNGSGRRLTSCKNSNKGTLVTCIQRLGFLPRGTMPTRVVSRKASGADKGTRLEHSYLPAIS